MKKVILGSVLAVAAASAFSAALTQTFCAGGAAGSGQAATINNGATDTTNNFVKSTFTPKCSANTHVYGQDGGSYYRVGSGSAKGKTRYAGTSVGGAVIAAGSCAAASGCVATDASEAMTSTYAATS